ncbi:hypothetical protein NX722_10660 [Endozoicomonas gorgoniicola]|uniref:TrmO C-terminal domain-containing protein n=1 Tax=Endozoicomonas gorgoniicola TaxID=1234144 RepID=A0ABT3MUM4_9GAMM|nr:hypothetical protein [Endozoicomonas gorgoniicola]MCW7553086.1 hypothetical protein [Endozoicomonas gorgoniicola]
MKPWMKAGELGQDPRPAYLRETTERRHGTALWDKNVV